MLLIKRAQDIEFTINETRQFKRHFGVIMLNLRKTKNETGEKYEENSAIY